MFAIALQLVHAVVIYLLRSEGHFLIILKVFVIQSTLSCTIRGTMYLTVLGYIKFLFIIKLIC